MDSVEIQALKELLELCPYVGFDGGGISERDDWSNEHLTLVKRVNRIVSNALVGSKCELSKELKSKLYRYV